MKKFLPWIAPALLAFIVLIQFRTSPEPAYHFRDFGRLPVLLQARVQPLDSVARNSLLQIRGTQAVPLEGNGGGKWGEWDTLTGPLKERDWWQFSKHPKKLKPADWLAEVLMDGKKADTRYIFLIHHPDLLSELHLENKGVERSGLHYFSFAEIEPQLAEIGAQAARIRTEKKESQSQTPVERQLLKLHNALYLYDQLKASIRPDQETIATIQKLFPRGPEADAKNVPVGEGSMMEDLDAYKKAIPAGVAALKKQDAGQPFAEADLNRLADFAGRFNVMANLSPMSVVPPSSAAADQREEWNSLGMDLLLVMRGGGDAEISPAALSFAKMYDSYRAHQVAGFNEAVDSYTGWMTQNFPQKIKKGRSEFLFNRMMPFYNAMQIYLFAFLFGCASWFNWSAGLRKTAFYCASLAWVVHTIGLVTRMWLEGRPPVTNLYSSAIFIGWGSVLLGLILERIFKDGIGTVTGSAIGFVTQIIAHNLAMGGDTMKMLQAVLDTNFWLATHVTVVTTGYASTFLAGFLGIVYILRGFFSKSLQPAMAKSLTRMIYGIVCFATLFSFVGTILGGIWADQSWGRFWGWDPKENGALIIVIWNAAILHARWGKMIGERGMATCAVFGNIVTSWSYFGVNMLGVGLHSYGFMDDAFKWLMLFVGIQLAIISIGLIPLKYWASFRKPVPAGKPGPDAGGRKPVPVG